MTAVVLTANSNFDDTPMLALANNDPTTINGVTLTIDGDTRWGQNAAVFGAMTISATLGGKIRMDATNVWEIAYDAPIGNIPALSAFGTMDVVGSISGATGEFLNIFTGLGVSPSAAGAAIPATGFVKLRKKTGTFVDNELLVLSNGATLTVNSATGGKRSWIHIVAIDATGAPIIPRLGSCEIEGSSDYYQIGVTNGTNDQTFQYPVADICPAIQIETSPGSGVYEWYLYTVAAGWAVTPAQISTDERGKYFGCSTAGLITIANTAVAACGFKPASGCKVRIPNLILGAALAASPTVNNYAASYASRARFNTTNAGALSIKKAVGTWAVLISNPYSLTIEDSGLATEISVTNPASLIHLKRIGIGGSDLNATLALAGCTQGIDLEDVRGSATNGFIATISDSTLVRCKNLQIDSRGLRGVITGRAIRILRCSDVELDTPKTINLHIGIESSIDVLVKNHQYADTMTGNTATTQGLYALMVEAASSNVIQEGFSSFAGLANVHPYLGLISDLNSSHVKSQLIGTPTSLYNGGSANAMGQLFNANTAIDFIGRQIYVQNTRLGAWTFGATNDTVLLENCWADAADNAGLSLASNMLVKGAKQTLANAGQTAIYGTHWQDSFVGNTSGYVAAIMNEPTVTSASQCAITAGTPRFTSTGQVSMPTVGDQVTLEMPYFALGHTALPNFAPTLFGTNTGNMTYQYQIDTGSGFGIVKTLNGTNLSGETISPTAGFKLRFIITTATANTTNAVTSVRIDTTTTLLISQAAQYPLPLDNLSADIGPIVIGSRIRVFNMTTNTEIANEVMATTNWHLDYDETVEFTAGDLVRTTITYTNGTDAKLPFRAFATASSVGFAVFVDQVDDEVYIANFIDGSTVTEFAADYPNVEIDVTDPDGVTTVQRVYAWHAYNLTTIDGIRYYYGGIEAQDTLNYKIDPTILDLHFDNVNLTPVMIVGGYMFRSDDSTVIASSSGSIQMDPRKAYGANVDVAGLGLALQTTLLETKAIATATLAVSA